MYVGSTAESYNLVCLDESSWARSGTGSRKCEQVFSLQHSARLSAMCIFSFTILLSTHLARCRKYMFRISKDSTERMLIVDELSNMAVTVEELI